MGRNAWMDGWMESFLYTGCVRFFFMHAINPLVFIMLYLLCTTLELKDKKDYLMRIFIAPLMMMAYSLFDLIFYIITGRFVYGLVSADRINVISVLLIGAGLYLLMAFMSYGLLTLKIGVQNLLTKNR